MGLDIYLYRYNNFAATKEKEKKYNEYSEGLWTKKYEETNDQERELIRTKSKQFACDLGLDEWGDDKEGKICIEENSTKYPDHYFKIGYFRSSYNSGGINSILKNLKVPGLYEIFNPNDQYCFKPDWDDALKKVKKSIKLLDTKGNFRVECISPNEFRNPNEYEAKDTTSAMDLFNKEVQRNAEGGYSNINGYFYGKGENVLAVIQGTTITIIGGHLIPCVYVVFDGENQWYRQALEIVQETIEWVLAQPDKDKYYLHWSS